MSLRATLRNFADGVSSGLRAGGDPNDERYWSSSWPQLLATSGVHVTPTLALQVSAVFQAVRLISSVVATLPLKPYRDRGDKGKEAIRGDYLWRGLHTKKGRPNPWQTAQQWRALMVARCLLWGGGYSRISAIDPLDLRPLDPERTKVDQMGDGRLRFTVTTPEGLENQFSQEEVFRLEGFGVHAYMPANLLYLAREAIGLWIAREKFEALFFAQGARPGLFVEHPGKPDKDRVKEIQARLQEKLGGLANMHKVVVGEHGMKLTPFGFDARQAQLTEQGEALVLEISRWFNIPAHLLGASKQPPYASREQMTQDFVDFCIAPICTQFEAAVDRDLIGEDDVFIEHGLDALLRGDTESRYQAHAIGIMNGFLSENEVRAKENLNPVDGLDTPRRSVNQDRGAEPRQGDPKDPPRKAAPPPPKDDEDEDPDARAGAPRRLVLVARAAAQRVVRREMTAIAKEATRLAKNSEAFEQWLLTFYQEHAQVVTENLQLEPLLSRAYSERHRTAVLQQGLVVLERWESEAVEELTALTLEEPAHA